MRKAMLLAILFLLALDGQRLCAQTGVGKDTSALLQSFYPTAENRVARWQRLLTWTGRLQPGHVQLRSPQDLLGMHHLADSAILESQRQGAYFGLRADRDVHDAEAEAWGDVLCCGHGDAEADRGRPGRLPADCGGFCAAGIAGSGAGAGPDREPAIEEKPQPP